MKKLLLAMSGGIDSSVSALMLLDKYEIVGATFRTYDSMKESCIAREKGCCTIESIMEAKRFAQSLGIDHHIVDFRERFAETVISNFVSEYLHGRTPNPCVVCNREIKWGVMLQKADELGCEYIATGHYARIMHENGRYFLRKGVDLSKDQTYFLWRLSQENLARTVFPLGEYTKDQIRAIADEKGFKALVKKRESQEICFVPDDDYRNFLRTQVPDIDEKIGEGDIVSPDGKVLGKHKGFPFYTIGQRKGLNVAVGHPVFVTEINPEKNTVTLGEREDLMRSEIVVADLNFMKYENLYSPMRLECKIRYNSKGVECEVVQEGDRLHIRFVQPVSAATPGQSAVLYDGDDVVAGGVIQ